MGFFFFFLHQFWFFKILPQNIVYLKCWVCCPAPSPCKFHLSCAPPLFLSRFQIKPHPLGFEDHQLTLMLSEHPRWATLFFWVCEMSRLALPLITLAPSFSSLNLDVWRQKTLSPRNSLFDDDKNVFLWQIFMEHLPCTRHHYRPWRYWSEQCGSAQINKIICYTW